MVSSLQSSWQIKYTEEENTNISSEGRSNSSSEIFSDKEKQIASRDFLKYGEEGRDKSILGRGYGISKDKENSK